MIYLMLQLLLSLTTHIRDIQGRNQITQVRRSPPRPRLLMQQQEQQQGSSTHRVGADEKCEEHDKRCECHQYVAANTGHQREADIDGHLKHRPQPLGQIDA